MQYQVLARKYRPKRFSEVVGQPSVVTTLKNAIRFDKIAHAYLFSGSRGVGKTTLARLFAKALNCSERTDDGEPCNLCTSCLEITSGQSLDVIEIDGASNRGIDDIRQINETVGYAPSQGKYKIYIIDEVHMLTKEAFNALLKTLEEPPARAKFFFATTEPHKVLPTIISRCQRFDLGRILPSQIAAKLEEISRDQNRPIEQEAIQQIATFADGSLRDAESLLDQIFCFAEGPVTAAQVRTSLGLVPQDHFFALDHAFAECRTAFAFELVDLLFQSGKDLSHFLEQLIDHYRLLTLYKVKGDVPPHYIESARLYTATQCLYILEYLLTLEAQLSKSASPRTHLEAALLHLIRSKNRVPVEVLVRRLSELESALAGAPSAAISPKVVDVETPAVSTPLLQKPLQETPEPHSEISLKPTPFNPYKDPEHTIPPAAEIASPAPQKKELPPEEPSDPRSELFLKPIPNTTPSLSKHPSHYDTLIRFTAVELEGSVKKG